MGGGGSKQSATDSNGEKNVSSESTQAPSHQRPEIDRTHTEYGKNFYSTSKSSVFFSFTSSRHSELAAQNHHIHFERHGETHRSFDHEA